MTNLKVTKKRKGYLLEAEGLEPFFYAGKLDNDYYRWNGKDIVPFQKLSENWYYIRDASWCGHLSEAPLFIYTTKQPYYWYAYLRQLIDKCILDDKDQEWFDFFKDELNILIFPNDAMIFYDNLDAIRAWWEQKETEFWKL